MGAMAERERSRRVMHPLRPRLITVSRVEPIVRDYVRVTFQGDDLVDFVTLDPDDHVKLIFPADGQDAPILPTWGDRGPAWPDAGPRPPLRDYTPRRFDPARCELDIDFVIHGSGPASSWAERAAPGQRLGMVGPRGSHIVDHAFDWYLMLGDETTLPSIARRLEEMPAGGRAIAVIEVDGPDQAQPIASAADHQIRWVYRDGAPAGTTALLERTVRALDVPDGSCFVWAGGEAATLRPIRRHLLQERGLNREWASFSGHWKRGVADHDHHEPIDDDEA